MKKFAKILAVVLAIATLTACLCFTLTACNKEVSDYEYMKGKGTLICGITLFEPMDYADEDGEITGFDAEFAQLVAEKLGLEAKFQVIKWNSKELELNSKSIDCIWNGLTVNEERKENMDFSQSYINNTQCVVVKSADLATLNTKAALEGKKAGAEAGSAGESAAKDLTENVTSVSAQMTALTELNAGTIDFAVVDVILAQSNCGKGDYADLAIQPAIELEAEEYAVGFRKGSDIVEKVNAAINELKADGTLLALAEKYGLAGQLIK
ncbi:MAG: transporter substrate-binding domain-containing protein [Clostridia bacterium]|nr:transporter substrate-binding domain-containing protein [Clostridia bacterium]